MGSEGERVVEDTVNFGTQFSTGGFVGFEDGEFTTGVTTDAAMSGMDRLTGRDIAVEQMRRAEARLAEEEAQREQLMEEERAQQERRARRASNMAGSIRNRRRSTGSEGDTGMMGEALGGERDFLGL